MDNEKSFIFKIYNEYKKSQEYLDIITSYEYYRGNQDILKKERKGIGPNGTTIILKNIPNNRIVDNRYSILVDQKKNYLLSRPITVECEDASYHEDITTNLFNKKFQKTLKNLGEDSLLADMGYLYPYINGKGEFKTTIFDPREILPIWTDITHSKLQSFLRFYIEKDYMTDEDTEIIEHYHINGITTYKVDGSDLRLLGQSPYFMYGDQERIWGEIPLVYFKRNRLEQPLLKMVKSLQDAINLILSRFMDDSQEDSRNTIITLKNLGGEQGNLGVIRQKMNEAGIIATTGDAEVGTLDIKVDPSNYRDILEILRKAIIDNGRGIDSDNEIFRSAPNQMAITSMYSEIDMDSDDMATEFSVSLHKLLDFYDLANGIVERPEIDFIFDKDILINENSTIENARNSLGIISNRTILANHPWVGDVTQELEFIKEERKEAFNELDDYPINFNQLEDDIR